MSNDNQSHVYIMYPLAVNESKPMGIINFNKRHTAFHIYIFFSFIIKFAPIKLTI